MRILSFMLFVVCSLGFVTQGHAASSDKQFFEKVQGKWVGPGEIVAGKYKGTKFVCTFDGTSDTNSTGMAIDGSCRVGVFSQPMNAMIKKIGNDYKGKFLDGAAGEGMDVVGGRYTPGRIVTEIRRKDLNGVMVTNLTRKNKMNITISVRVSGKLIPVIGMSLDRVAGPKLARAN